MDGLTMDEFRSLRDQLERMLDEEAEGPEQMMMILHDRNKGKEKRSRKNGGSYDCTI
jgi:hypothetical protein